MPPPPAPQAQQAEQAHTPATDVPDVAPDTGPPPAVTVAATSTTATASPAAETSPTTTSTTSPTLTQPPPTPATNARPDPANTRVLLRSLEELRDSLSVRVEQLSLAVDRLRGQATELERAVTSGTALAPGFGRPVHTSAARFDPLPAPALATRRYTVRTVGEDEPPYEPVTQHTRRTAARTGSVAAAAGGRGAAPSRLGPITRRGGAAAASAVAAATTTTATTSSPSPTSPAASRSVGHHPRVGSSPTNLKVTATQPKPIVVRSPRPSVEPAAPAPAVTVSEDGAESGTSTPQAHATAVFPPIVSNDDDTAPRLRPPPRLEWTLSAVMERRPSPEPTSVPIRPRRIASVLDQNRAPTLATLSARGITTRGMMVRERQGLNAPAPQTASSTSSSDSSSDELLPFTQVMAHRIREQRTDFAGAFRFQDVIADHPPPPRDIETLDREIQLYLTRLAASQREWTRAWEMERDRAMQGGRVPNEFSAQRESAMRNHVANSHRLWYLLSRRASRRGPRDRDAVDSQLAVDATTTTRLPVRDYPSSPRAANRPVSVYAGTAPPIPNDATIEDMERRWIERIERERAGGPSEASEDQFEFEYYRNYLYENRRSRRSLSSTTDDSGDANDSWPQRRLELLELIAQSRSYVTGTAAATTTAPTSAPTTAPTTAPSDEAEDRSSFRLPSVAVDYVNAMREREATDAAISGVFNLPASISSGNPGEDDFWHTRRRDLLEYIEQSRARVHDMARELSPSVLQEERPALRRVLEGLERMLALDDDMSPDMRARLERLAARERELLRDIGEEPPAPVQRSAIESLASVEVTTRRGDRQRQVVERIERTRSRLRELSRIHRDLSTVRAGMGLAPAPRSAQSPLFTRRDSDAETVVPDLGSPEETFWAADEEADADADEAEPASGPTTGSNSDAQLRSSLMSLSLSADSDASSEPESTDAREGVRTFAFEDDGVADKEGGLLAAETWPSAPALPRRVRRYVSLVDL
ncbi:uncharacterized protein LOC62_01G001424 [Vanrija pseudolonga]|uniref:Uncharacterized protein n=1 Tax=Vanrija pseudolonga TaxID=143232 RepID=A0AAF0Y553_9TREE|nr:hypothetical protein LOC62_01G001424 [Vanrija pseudolonga]